MSKRIFKYKNPSSKFLCPLCGIERAVRYSPRLTLKNYLQIIMLSIPVIYFLFPLMEMRSFFSFFLIWFIFEGTVRTLYAKEVPCPHCGFDASWYKRDVRVAREKVQEFWKKKNSEKADESENQVIEKESEHHGFDLPPSETSPEYQAQL